MIRVSLVRYFLALGTIATMPAFALVEVEEAARYNAMPYVQGRVLVKTRATSDALALAQTADDINAILVEDYHLVPGLSLFLHDPSMHIAEAIEAFLANENVEYAEPDYYFHAALQNDPLFPQLWGLENTGQSGGTVDADINAMSMWQRELGSASVVIGIIDTGVDYSHPDLAPNMWRNPSEIAGNGVDDDGNGYVDDVYGINAILNNGNPRDDHMHGSHVAGTIGADGNNAVGVVGVAQNVQMVACKFLDASGSGSTSDAIKCLQYFASLKSRPVNPVNIVATNNSWGGGSSSVALRNAIEAHQNLGILFVAAAGNAAQNNDNSNSYPANYELANVISVAATDRNDSLAPFSNYGKKTVHVAAPGVSILSTVLNQGYAQLSGTSMATPHVTGLIAIVKSANPTFDYKQIKNLILSGGTPLNALQANTITGRRIRGADTNGRGSLTCVNQAVNARLKPTANSASINLGSSILLSSLRLNCEVPAGPLTLYSDAQESVILRDDGLNGDVVANDGIYSSLWQPSRGGVYSLNFGGGDIFTLTVIGSSAGSYAVSNVPFAYESILGRSLGASDESMRAINIPFSIHFNGNSVGYNYVYISTNGTLSFTSSANPGYVNATLPKSSVSTFVAPFWDDLIPSGTNSNIYVAINGDAPNRRLIVEWRNLRHYNSSGRGTFQAVFYENSADLRFNYLDTVFDSAAIDSGRSATVGVQTSASTATQYSFNAPLISSSTSLLFRLQ